MAFSKQTAPSIDEVRPYLHGVAKHLVDRIWGPRGPVWGTKLTEMEDLLVSIQETLAERMLQHALTSRGTLPNLLGMLPFPVSLILPSVKIRLLAKAGSQEAYAVFQSLREVWGMGNFNVATWILGFGFLFLPSLAAQSQTPPEAAPAPMSVGVVSPASWDAGESHRGYVPRDFQSDGTTPAISKGREVKLDVKREVQPASLDSPIAQTTSSTLPRMPHGYLDPTHPAGPAEAGSAAPLHMPKRKPGPYTSGFTVVQIWRTTR